jgi:hypothetical protein
MGCETCVPEITAGAELTRDDAVFAATATLSRVSAEPACSHHYGGKSVLLDWAVKRDLAELPNGRHVVVSGPCGDLGCDALGSELPAQRYLSDHCPIWLDLDDVDRD